MQKNKQLIKIKEEFLKARNSRNVENVSAIACSECLRKKFRELEITSAPIAEKSFMGMTLFGIEVVMVDGFPDDSFIKFAIRAEAHKFKKYYEQLRVMGKTQETAISLAKNMASFTISP